MVFKNPSREEIKRILQQAKNVAVVGLSNDAQRTSYLVSEAMQKSGYRIIPVNPNGPETILGEKRYDSLSDIPEPVDIVNVFRRSEYCAAVAEEAVKVKARVLWLQKGIISQEAARIAQDGGLFVIMDSCIKVEDAILRPKAE